MSQLKFTQIQDMLILLSKKVTNLETAMKDLGEAVAAVDERTAELEKKEEEREEKEAVKAGSWKSAGTGAVEAEGSIYLLETTDEGGKPIYKFKIESIPAYKPIDANDKTYVFTPTDTVEIKMPDGATFPEITVNAKDAADPAKELTYKLTYDPATGAFTLTMQDGYTIPDTPLEITLEPIAETDIPRAEEEEPVNP